MKKIANLLLLVAALALPALAQQAQPPGDAARGKTLAQHWCSDCHLLKGEKQAVEGIPPFETIARDPGKTPEYLRLFLTKPHTPMPPIELDRRQIEDVVAYIETLRAQ